MWIRKTRNKSAHCRRGNKVTTKKKKKSQGASRSGGASNRNLSMNSSIAILLSIVLAAIYCCGAVSNVRSRGLGSKDNSAFGGTGADDALHSQGETKVFDGDLVAEMMEADHSDEVLQRAQRKLATASWFPKWGTEYDDGYCKQGTPPSGITSFSTKEECCQKWFPFQMSFVCIGGDPYAAAATSPTTTTTTTTAASPTTAATTTSSATTAASPTTSTSATTATIAATIIQNSDNCTDSPKIVDGKEVEGEEWVMPEESVWRFSAFAKKTCAQLEEIIPTDDAVGRQKFCNFLSSHINTGASAKEACCFCGGGSEASKSNLQCENMEFNSLEDGAENFDCLFIEEHIPDEDMDLFCKNFGNDTFAMNGVTIKEACCVCGGGDKQIGQNSQAGTRRKLQDNISLPFILADRNLEESYDKQEKIRFEYKDIQRSPGVPNIEYLGLGYDILQGNPRGSESSELDPGFRYPVISLQNPNELTTFDGYFEVPVGTAVKYVSSCKYDSSSVEVSSESDVRKSLTQEASSSTSVSASGTYEASSPMSEMMFSLSVSYAFSQSSRFQSESSQSKNERSVSFESKAVCSEFEASFIPSAEQSLHPQFKAILDELPSSYNANNRGIFETFLKRYGTHYVHYVILGGKRIQKTSMSQSDYSSLVSQSVDVESTMSFEMSAAFAHSVNERKKAETAQVQTSTGKGGETQANSHTAITIEGNCEDDDGELFSTNYQVNAAGSYSQFASSASQAEQAMKISQKKTKTTELTIGGLPSDDWRAWAASVREKPMPIKYEMQSLVDFMKYTQQVAFADAIKDIYGIDVSTEKSKDFLKKTVHHGVYTGKGDPLSKHTLNPDDDTRVLMQVDEVTRLSATGDKTDDASGAEVIEVFDKGKGDFFNFVNDNVELGACAVKFFYQNDESSGCDPHDEVGIYDIQFKYCNIHDYSSDNQFHTIASVPGSFVSDVVMDKGGGAFSNTDEDCQPQNSIWDCQANEFLCGFDIGYCGGGLNDNHCEDGFLDNDMGIYKLRAWCKPIGEACDSEVGHHCNDADGDGCDDDLKDDYQSKVRLDSTDKMPSRPGTDYVIAGASTKFGQDADDKVGISALKLNVRAVVQSQSSGYGPPSSIFTYSGVWKGMRRKPTAYFATPIRLFIAPNVVERNKFPFQTKFVNKKYPSWRNNFYFTLSNNINSAGALAVTNFGDLSLDYTGSSRLPSFSFLTVESLNNFGDQLLSGVVSYNGLIVDDSGKDEFDVTMSNARLFEVAFKKKDYTTKPTVIAFPNWFSLDEEFFPQQINDVAFVIKQIENDYFNLEHGNPSGDISYFGFNFLLISEDMDTDNVKHGIITDCTDDNSEGTKHGISVDSSDCTEAFGYTSINIDTELPSHMGVKVTFDKSFSDIPSVIATPYGMEYEGANSDIIPRCIVESITKYDTVVKCGFVREAGDGNAVYKPIPFTFVAVGHKKEE